jgi:tRNA A37 threonylcarbamoyladenosine dehydratase
LRAHQEPSPRRIRQSCSGKQANSSLALSDFLIAIKLFQIDLDTIDVTNLNRQFLFQRCHVGKAKSEVAKESAMKFNPEANITAIRDSIMK